MFNIYDWSSIHGTVDVFRVLFNENIKGYTQSSIQNSIIHRNYSVFKYLFNTNMYTCLDTLISLSITHDNLKAFKLMTQHTNISKYHVLAKQLDANSIVDYVTRPNQIYFTTEAAKVASILSPVPKSLKSPSFLSVDLCDLYDLEDKCVIPKRISSLTKTKPSVDQLVHKNNFPKQDTQDTQDTHA